jgi:hypothetical protein
MEVNCRSISTARGNTSIADTQQRPHASVELNSLKPTDFVDGCALELPEPGQVQDILVSRVPAMGRDPAVGYTSRSTEHKIPMCEPVPGVVPAIAVDHSKVDVECDSPIASRLASI